MTQTKSLVTHKIFNAAVIVAALGYFVDIYDLVLFSIVRTPSLKSLGLADDEILHQGVWLLDLQMIGMLVGGIFWGILGDKRGRLSVLFGSIGLYSLANIANGFVHTVPQYAVLRVIAGIGLAGELGAGITLVSEIMHREARGMGTTLVATVGVSGAVLAGLIAKYFDWRTCYFIGGGLGLALLALRVSVFESGLFEQVKTSSVARGDMRLLFFNRTHFVRYLRCILIGVPLWYVVGILVTLSPEFAIQLGVIGEVKAGDAVMWCYAGITLGDFLSGFLSQLLKSRKWAVGLFLMGLILGMLGYFNAQGFSANQFYGICFFLGLAVGYWAVFVTIAAEQFGTNIRSTVTTTVPNFVRGSLVLVSLAFLALKESIGIMNAAMIVGAGVVILAGLGLWGMEETYGKDLDYITSN